MRSSWEIFFLNFFFDNTSNMCTTVFSNPYGQVVHIHHLVVRVIKTGNHM